MLKRGKYYYGSFVKPSREQKKSGQVLKLRLMATKLKRKMQKLNYIREQ